MKRIMILGAGINQLPLIEAANESGLYTIVCDYNSEAVGASYANEFFCVSINDEKKLLEIAEEKCIDGIVANSESVMTIVAKISSYLGLRGNSELSIKTLQSKYGFREIQQQCGLYAPSAIEVDELDSCIQDIKSLHYPIICKPSESSGTRGTKLIQEYDYMIVKEAYESCRSLSRNHLVTFEEYVELEGTQVVEGEVFINNSQFFWEGLFTTVRSESAKMIPMSYFFPVHINALELDSIKVAVEKVLNKLDVKFGEYNIEVYFVKDSKKPFIIEINARQGGNFLPKYVQLSTGVNLYKLLVTTAVGDDGYWKDIQRCNIEHRKILHHMVYPRNRCRYKGVFVDDLIRKYLRETSIDVEVNQKLDDTVDAESTIGYIDFEFDDSFNEELLLENPEKFIYIEEGKL